MTSDKDRKYSKREKPPAWFLPLFVLEVQWGYRSGGRLISSDTFDLNQEFSDITLLENPYVYFNPEYFRQREIS